MFENILQVRHIYSFRNLLFCKLQSFNFNSFECLPHGAFPYILFVLYSKTLCTIAGKLQLPEGERHSAGAGL